MFTYTRELRSGTGTVAYHKEANMLVATLWDAAEDNFTVLETVTFEGLDDERACRAMMRGFLNTYAANN